MTGKDTLFTIGFRVPDGYLNALRDEIYQDAVAHGLWKRHDEILKNADENQWFACAEAKEASSRHDCATYILEEGLELKEACEDAEEYAEELADVIIMSMSVAGKLGIDIDAAIRRKMEINKKRPWKHGKTE